MGESMVSVWLRNRRGVNKNHTWSFWKEMFLKSNRKLHLNRKIIVFVFHIKNNKNILEVFLSKMQFFRGSKPFL